MYSRYHSSCTERDCVELVWKLLQTQIASICKTFFLLTHACYDNLIKGFHGDDNIGALLAFGTVWTGR